MAVRTQAIDEVFKRAIEAGEHFGVVAAAADTSGVIYEGAFGRRSVESDDPVTMDTMFRIASMTKMVTTVAALQQVEAGQLQLDAPVDTYLPAFAEVQVLEGFDAETPRLRPPASRATVRQLMTHTAGLPYWFLHDDAFRYQDVTGTQNVLSGMNSAFDNPMICDPGTAFNYGMNTDWLGKVVEATSGETLDAYFRNHVLGPLKMLDTTVKMTAEQRDRSVPVHVRNEDGSFAVTVMDLPQEPEFWAGGHALYSTANDYLRFQRMLLGGGTLDGTRILQSETVDEAFRNQIGDLDFPMLKTSDPMLTLDVDLGPNLKWGLGLLLNTTAQPGMRAAGSGAWAGLFNSHFWIDRQTGVAACLLLQYLPFFDPRSVELYVAFEQALYANL